MKRTLTFCSIIATLTFLLAATSASAQEKAFKISGEGVAPQGFPLPTQDPRPHWVAGVATHLGLHTGEGSVETDTADFSEFPVRITGKFGSGQPFVFVAANGDKLVCDYGRGTNGEFEGDFELMIVDFDDPFRPLVQALFLAEFVPRAEESTGRFAGITGSWFMVATTDTFVLGATDPVGYQWTGEGKLKFAKGKSK